MTDVQPAPIVERLLAQVRGWVGIEVVTHRFGGAEVRIGRCELAHLHASGALDVHFPVALRNCLIDSGWASAHHVLPASGWVTYALPHESEQAHGCEDDPIACELAIRGALRLLRVAYMRHKTDWAAGADAIPMLMGLCDDAALATHDSERESVSA
ncbi:MAG: DUF5519 family protein [Clostridia bacterium]|nr:DUF5519 family protein [Deltaproteobacteria bacterium]